MLSPIPHHAIHITDKNNDIYTFYVEVDTTVKDIVDFADKKFKKQYKEILLGNRVLVLKYINI